MQTQDGFLEECWFVGYGWGEVDGAQGRQRREREVLGDKPPQPGAGRAHSLLVRLLSSHHRGEVQAYL